MKNIEINHDSKVINLEAFKALNLEHGDIIALQIESSINEESMKNMARSIGNFVKVHNEQFPKKQINAIILPPKCSVGIIRPVDISQEPLDSSCVDAEEEKQ